MVDKVVAKEGSDGVQLEVVNFCNQKQKWVLMVKLKPV